MNNFRDDLSEISAETAAPTGTTGTCAYETLLRPVRLFLKLNFFLVGYFDPVMLFLTQVNLIWDNEYFRRAKNRIA